MRRSFDNGKSWQPMQTLLAVSEGGVGDASLLLDHSNGRIWCFFSYGPPGIGFQNAKSGAVTGPTTLQVHAIHSDDDGSSWSQQTDLTPQIKDASWQAIFATSGADIQLHSGRFLLPLVARDQKGVIHSLNAYSDDHGHTWKHGSFIGDHTDESHSVELADGTVMQNMRDGTSRAIALSHDGGITFDAVRHDAALIDPGCNAGILHYIFRGTDALIFTNAASTRRENLTVKISYDNGRSWPQQRTLNPGPSAYSAAIQLRDGSIAILYEHGDTDSIERITFARFNLPWITAQQK
jgi:sialidase-1